MIDFETITFNTLSCYQLDEIATATFGTPYKSRIYLDAEDGILRYEPEYPPAVILKDWESEQILADWLREPFQNTPPAWEDMLYLLMERKIIRTGSYLLWR